ncbi:amino-acid permease inda1 [Colletotrichum liriopes]|uniref:Amino-acid permease inda1 n=1 Tax=Colletotrichum liriopes TaxID=708192 RepID=A0AA37GQS6_9PEZI|nr:amino-acid permease inda1 [Colletotrichum liriopes]
MTIEAKAVGSRTPSGAGSVEVAPTTEGDKLKRNISIRHMVFMALGGSIGAGLFVGSGAALSSGGPLSLVTNFAIVGFGVTCTMGCLGELAAAFPVAGAFYEYSRRMISEPWGFAMGWNFVFNWLIVFPFELTVIAAQMEYWVPDLQPAYIFWHDPGAVKNGLSGFLMVFRVAGMSYGGTELLGMTAAECKNPQKALPLATKVVFARIFFFYIVSLLLLGFVVSSDDPGLASTGHGAKYSPFTLAAQLANIQHLPSFFNALIVVAIVSMANTSIFAASRAFQALCEKGMGPRWGATVKWGVPVYAFLITFIFGLIAFANLAPGGGAIFDWLLSLSGASNYYTWASICVSHIRFRKAWAAQGHDHKMLLWNSPFGAWGAWVGVIICVVGLSANMLTAIWPVSGHDAQAVIRDNIGTVIPVVLYFGYRLWQSMVKKLKQPVLIPLDQVDVRTGIRLHVDSSSSDDLEVPSVVTVKKK